MSKAIAALLIAATLAVPAAAAPERGQIYAGVKSEIGNYVPNADIEHLSRAQLGEIYLILYSRRSAGEKKASILAVIDGRRNTLRGLLFGAR